VDVPGTGLSRETMFLDSSRYLYAEPHSSGKACPFPSLALYGSLHLPHQKNTYSVVIRLNERLTRADAIKFDCDRKAQRTVFSSHPSLTHSLQPALEPTVRPVMDSAFI